MWPEYLDYPVLDWAPSWREATTRLRFTQSKVRLDSGAGPIDEDALLQPRPRTTRTLTYTLTTREEMVTAREFLRDVSLGRLKGFWASLGLSNLELASPLGAASAALVVDAIGYTRYNFGAGYGREHLLIRPASSASILYRKVTAAVDNEDGTETLTLSAVPGESIAVGSRIEYLVLNRLDADLCFLTWNTMHSGTLVLPLIDLPRETP
jgi:hypothetical protein